MKKIFGILCMLFLLTIFIVSCHDGLIGPSEKESSSMTRAMGADTMHYYWYKGEKIYLILNTDYVNVIATDNFLKSSNTSSLFQKYNIVPDDSKQTGNMVKLRLSSKSTVSEYSEMVNDLKQNAQIKYVLPFFERGDAEPIGTSDIFYLKLKDANDVATLNEMVEKQNVQIIKEVPNTPLWYILSIQNSAFNNSIDASNYFYETGYFEDIDPAFMFNYQPTNTNDPMFSQLWGLKNTSYPGIDINVIDAWTITRGAGANVAVVDRGIDPNHNDLKANFHTLSFNARTGTSPSVFLGHDHGTHVAGIAAAVGNNNLQVVGVAYQSKIMRVSHDLYFSNTISSELAGGINWAWQNGAHVINNSWGDQGGAYYGYLQSAILEQAIVNALTQGRNGLGCVVVFAGGNKGHTSPVMDYPAIVLNDILAVGSIDSNGSKSNFSGYGPALDIVAPGSNILSTLPYNSTGYMSGTSMAAPHVSGVAAYCLLIQV